MDHARRTILDPHLDRLSTEEGWVILALRRASEDVALRLVDHSSAIEALVDQFEDTTVRAGCIEGGKLRRDRTHVRAYLLRRFFGMSRPQVAATMGLGPRYARYSIVRGRRLLEQASRDGRLDAALASIGQVGP